MDDTRQYSILYFFSLQKCKKRHSFQPFHFNDLSPQMHSAFAHILIIILSACCIIICITLLWACIIIILVFLFNHFCLTSSVIYSMHAYASIAQMKFLTSWSQDGWIYCCSLSLSLCFLCIYIYTALPRCVYVLQLLMCGNVTSKLRFTWAVWKHNKNGNFWVCVCVCVCSVPSLISTY